MENRTRASIRAFAKLIEYACLVMVVFASTACRFPLAEKPGKADFTLNFIISGMNPEARAAAVGPSGAERLLLPTVTSLTVTLSSNAGSFEPQTRTAAIGTETIIPVGFSDVPFGEYTVKADAYAADGTTLLFTQTSPLKLSSAIVSATLNLVPTNRTAVASIGELAVSATISNGTSRTWFVPAGSPLVSSDSLWLTQYAGLTVYIQGTDGRLLSASSNSGRISTGVIRPNEDIYITLYNISTSPATPSLCAGMAMVAVPAGTFRRDATPANTSYVSAFSLGKYEVTRAQYLAVMGTDPTNAVFSSGISDPVQHVNWYHAIAFCNKLSIAEGLTPVYSVTGIANNAAWTGLAYGSIPVTDDAGWNAATADWTADGYRLPTEMEWRWAAMGGMSDAIGSDIVAGINIGGYLKGYSGSSETAGAQSAIGNYAWYNDILGTTKAAGTKRPNELGIHDMSGNVWEWCWDFISDPPSLYPSNNRVNYTGPPPLPRRIFVGSSYSEGGMNLPTVANRDFTFRNPWEASDAVGLRVVRGSLPSRTFVYVTDPMANDTVWIYQLDPLTGRLTNEGVLNDTNHADRIVIDPSKRFAFTTNYDGSTGTVRSYTINKDTGILTLVNSWPASTTPLDIVMDESGKFVYVASGSANIISMFSINQTTGALLSGPVTTPTPGPPQSLAVKGAYLYCVCYLVASSADAIQSFAINPADGSLGTAQSAQYLIGRYQNGIAIYGDYLYIGEANSAGASSIRFNPVSGEIMSPVSSTPDIGWPVPDSVFMDPLGQFFFLPIGTNTLWRVPFTSTNGAFGTPANTGITASYAAFNPSGTYMLGLSGTTLTSYVLNRSTGVLSSTGFTETAGSGSNSIVTVSIP